jgi:fructose-bisphosphate aldolase class II
MPIASYQDYNKILDAAKKSHYALPAINVSSALTANAAMQGFAESKSDGIIQLSTGAGEFASGLGVKDMALGARAVAEHIHTLADRYNVFFLLHTDHCIPKKWDGFVRPLLEWTKERRAKGLPNLFNSHMFDGSELPVVENVQRSKTYLEELASLELVLELEIGVVGGEEDGINNEGVAAEKLFTSPEDMLYTYETLSKVPNASYMLAATFGNVHGVYKPGNVKLSPKILKNGQDLVMQKHGQDAKMNLVFHGGSGSELADIHETLDYGVVKMNVDTDTQYAYTRAVAHHMYQNYDSVLKVDSEVGKKKFYDIRSYSKAAEENMAKRVQRACEDLKSTGKTLFTS